MTGAGRDDPVVQSVTAAVYEVPTDQQEADGTLAWSSTTMVLAEVSGGGHTGLGYTYGSAAGKPRVKIKIGESWGAAEARDLTRIEYFHDHVRIESMFFDGALSPSGGALRPDRSRPGLGLSLKEPNAAPYRTA